MPVDPVGVNAAARDYQTARAALTGPVEHATDAQKTAVVQAQDSMKAAETRSQLGAKTIYDAHIKDGATKPKAMLSTANHQLQKFPRMLAGSISRNPRLATLLALGGTAGLGGGAYVAGEHHQGRKDEAKTGVPMA